MTGCIVDEAASVPGAAAAAPLRQVTAARLQDSLAGL